jgi:hypothetical protein
MENIELRSEKVRNLIGSIPPVIVRLGNILVLCFILILFALSNFIKIPNTVKCNIMAKGDRGHLTYHITSIERVINYPLPKDSKVYIYSDNELIEVARLRTSLNEISLSGENIDVDIPLYLDDKCNGVGVQVNINPGTTLRCEIVLDDISILNHIL